MFWMLVCLVGMTGCGKDQKDAETLKQESSLETETEDANESVREAEEKDSKESDREAEEQKEQEEAETIEPKALIQWQPYEETLCDKEEGTELVTLSWQLPELVGDIFPGQEKINAALLEDMEQTLEKIKKEDATEEEMYQEGCVYAIAKSDYGYRKEDAEANGIQLNFEPYYYGQSYELKRADGEVISLISITETYYGGAHGSQVIAGVNYDAQTGEKLSLSDIWSEERLFRETCEKEILTLAEEKTKEIGEVFFSNYEESVPDLIADGLWYFSGEGLVFISQEYMLQPYAAGTIEFEISYDKLRECLK